MDSMRPEDRSLRPLDVLRERVLPEEGLRGAMTLMGALFATSLASALPGVTHRVLTAVMVGAMLSVPAAVWVRLQRLRTERPLGALWGQVIAATGFAVVLGGLLLAVARVIEPGDILPVLPLVLGPMAAIAWVRSRVLAPPDGFARRGSA